MEFLKRNFLQNLITSNPKQWVTWSPFLILVTALLATTATSAYVYRQTKEEERLVFNNYADNTTNTLEERLDTYIELLRAGEGLFATKEDVTPLDWRNFVSRQMLKQEYPGIFGLGYASRVNNNNEGQTIHRVQEAGYPDYKIWPQAGGVERFPVLYIEPNDEGNKTSLGFDMATEPAIKSAMDKARDSGEPAMSGKVTLIQEVNNQKPLGFLIYYPVYEKDMPTLSVEDRRRALKGFVYEPFGMGDFMAGSFNKIAKDGNVKLQIFDGLEIKPENQLYDSNPSLSGYNFRTIRRLSLASANWTLLYTSPSPFTQSSQQTLPSIILVIGSLISMWLFSITRSQVEARNRAEQVAVELKRSQRDLKTTNTRVYFLAEASKILSSSLDIDKTVNNLARIAVPQISDWCVIDMIEADGSLKQVAIYARDPKKLDAANKLRKEYLLAETNSPTGIAHVIKTGQPEYVPVITKEMRRAFVKDKKELELVETIGFSSIITVPLFTGKKSIGCITLANSESNRILTKDDLDMAQELSSRVSLAFENTALLQQREQAIRLRDEFISIASHELKTPITSLKVYTQLLQSNYSKLGKAETSKYLDKMSSQVDNLTNLIQDLLDVSRIQRGRLEYRQEYFDMDNLVHEVVGNLRETAPHKITVSGKISKKIFGDKERISQVITNLLSNAIKYSPGQKDIYVNMEQTDNTAMVSVKDYGIGIEKSHLPRIFNRFYRVSDTSERTFPGLGIGLYISHEIVRRHGGKIWVDSVKGKGSTFTFSLPMDKTAGAKRGKGGENKNYG